LKKFGDLVV
jgi:hypothetical protein